MEKKILIIEDELKIAELLMDCLMAEGFSVVSSNSGKDGLCLVENHAPDLILLDLMLPDLDGFTICKRITEEYNIPIIMITAKSDMGDKLNGLKLGADDYITKPFDIREVIERIRSIFRRIDNIKEHNNEGNRDFIVINDEIKLHPDEGVVKRKDKIVELTRKEYKLLQVLAENRNKIFTRENLLDTVWGYDYLGDIRTVDIHIQRIRKKLDLKEHIKTVFGVGYKLI